MLAASSRRSGTECPIYLLASPIRGLVSLGGPASLGESVSSSVCRRLGLCFLDVRQRIEDDLIPFLQASLTTINMSLLSPRLERTALHSRRPFRPSRRIPLRFQSTAAVGIDQHVLVPSQDHFDFGGHAGFQPSTEGSSMIVSYFTTFPVHQPAGRVTEATDDTSPSSVLSGSVTVAGNPRFECGR